MKWIAISSSGVLPDPGMNLCFLTSTLLEGSSLLSATLKPDTHTIQKTVSLVFLWLSGRHYSQMEDLGKER